MHLSRTQARDLDARAIHAFGIPGIVLMENAGRNMAQVLLALGVRGRVAICCGRGNNGGDGFVIARYLDNAGIPLRVLLFTRPDALTGDAAIAYRIIASAGLPIDVLDTSPLDEQRLQTGLADAEWIVDGVFGTGLQGAVRAPFDRVIDAINASPAQVFAIDIPSGLDCDTGQPLGCAVRANHTATVVAPKQGFAAPGAVTWLGQVHVVDFGAPRRLLESLPALE